MTYKPPPQPPREYGPDITPRSLSAPPIMHYSIDASQNWMAQNQQPDIVADMIVQSYSSSIDHFITNRRQQNQISDLPQTRHQASFPGLIVDHLFNQGLETIKLTVYPEFNNPFSSQPVIDINLDGYIVWTHVWNDQEEGYHLGTYDVVLNGYTILSDYQPPTPAASGPGVTQFATAIIVAFGPTALVCQSLHDDVNPLNKTVNQENATASGGLLPKIEPARSQIKPYVGLFGGSVPQDGASRDDVFGYFMFDVAPSTNTTGWSDPYNPSRWAYDGDQYNTDPTNFIWSPAGSFNQLFHFLGTPQPIQILKVIQFADASNSPLVASGPNVFTVQQHDHSATNRFPLGHINTVAAEFYDRGSLRVATNTWTNASPDGGFALVSDKPLYFDSESNFLIDFAQLGFDLTPTAEPVVADIPISDLAMLGEGTFPLTTVAEQRVIQANQTALGTYQSALNAMLDNTTSAQTNVINAVFGVGVIPNSGGAVILDDVGTGLTNLNAYNAAVLLADGNIAALRAAFNTAVAAESGRASGINTVSLAITTDYANLNLINEQLIQAQDALTNDKASLKQANIPPGGNPPLVGYLNTVVNQDQQLINSLTQLQTQQNTTLTNDILTAQMMVETPAQQIVAENDFETAWTSYTAYLAANPNPPTPQAQQVPFADGSGDIAQFSYRTIIVDNGEWTFGPYSGA